MHDIEPHFNWRKYYTAETDAKSPFYRKKYDNTYTNDIYGYYIDPQWDNIGSETLYCKLLYCNYTKRCCIIELFGELNDALHNDSMYLKRNLIDPLLKRGINQFVLLTDNLLQFHGGATDYYEEWFEDIEDGWITAVNVRHFIADELAKYRLDSYINFGGTLEIENWRTLKPDQFYELINSLIIRRLG